MVQEPLPGTVLKKDRPESLGFLFRMSDRQNACTAHRPTEQMLATCWVPGIRAVCIDINGFGNFGEVFQ